MYLTTPIQLQYSYLLRQWLFLPLVVAISFLTKAQEFEIESLADCAALDSFAQQLVVDTESIPVRPCERAFLHAESLDCSQVAAQLSYTIAVFYHRKHNYSQAIDWYDTAIGYARESQDTSKLLKSYYYKGWSAYDNKYYALAHESFKAGLGLIQPSDTSREWKYRFYTSLADNFGELSDYPQSIGHYQKALDIAEELRSPTKISRVYNNLGVIHRERKDYQKAKEYFQFAIKSLESDTSEYVGLFFAHLNLGHTLCSLQNHDQAIEELQLALHCAKASEDSDYVAFAEMLLGKAWMIKKDFTKAKNYLLSAKQQLEISGDTEDMSMVHQYLGNLYLQNDNFEKAEYHLQLAIEKLQPVGHSLEFDLIESYALLSDLYARQGLYREALQSHQKFNTLSDSIYAKTHNTTLSHQDFLLETNRINKERTNEAVSLQEQVVEKNRLVHLQRTIAVLLGLLLLTAIISGIFLFRSARSKSTVNKVLQKLNRQILDQKEAIERKNEQLETTNHQLENANDRLVHFVYSVSHDLKGPLNNIIGFLELLQQSARSKLNPDEQQYLTYMQQSSSHMDSMIRELRTYAELGQNLPPMKLIALNQLVQEVIDDLSLKINETNAQLNIEAMPSIEGHPTLIRQLYQNLISNALKYHADDRQPVITIGAQGDEDNTTFFVKDNGVGIPENSSTRIFEMFSRAHSGQYKGSGMGLALCKRIVEIHKGNIWVQSAPDKGSTFFFTLPVEKTETATIESTPTARLHPQFLI